MNQQIRELAQQAGMYVDVKGEPWPKWMGAEECEAAYARFAELIVQECANMAESFHHHQYDFTGNLELHEFIKTHFGVEE